jgi:hypothetical protein
MNRSKCAKLLHGLNGRRMSTREGEGRRRADEDDDDAFRDGMTDG